MEKNKCISCQEPLTVEHIMVHCADYIHIRDNYYTVNNIHELINNVDPKDILGFLREAVRYYYYYNIIIILYLTA